MRTHTPTAALISLSIALTMTAHAQNNSPTQRALASLAAATGGALDVIRIENGELLVTGRSERPHAFLESVLHSDALQDARFEPAPSSEDAPATFVLRARIDDPTQAASDGHTRSGGDAERLAALVRDIGQQRGCVLVSAQKERAQADRSEGLQYRWRCTGQVAEAAAFLQSVQTRGSAQLDQIVLYPRASPEAGAATTDLRFLIRAG